ncbi:hypothetical protein EI982_15305 [Haloplanus rallus]|uniref:Uncharacterized protein n=1 Tax=Haloplanus rallus TaxID=1816183 RepID=A0A6B9F6M6_9EURY|nr:hypothetical protein [Haloplanus rallus]QGX96048.1 hypothetical protein EI982_15305 [Haloplanus rallus]
MWLTAMGAATHAQEPTTPREWRWSDRAVADNTTTDDTSTRPMNDPRRTTGDCWTEVQYG